MIIVRIAERDDFIAEVSENKPLISAPVRISCSEAPGQAGASDTGTFWYIVKAGAIAGEQLLELTVVKPGEGSAEQEVKALEEAMEKLDLEVRPGTQYEVV